MKLRCANSIFCCLPDERVQFNNLYRTRRGYVPNITLCWSIKKKIIPVAHVIAPTIITYSTPGDYLDTEDDLFDLACENGDILTWD